MSKPHASSILTNIFVRNPEIGSPTHNNAIALFDSISLGVTTTEDFKAVLKFDPPPSNEGFIMRREYTVTLDSLGTSPSKVLYEWVVVRPPGYGTDNGIRPNIQLYGTAKTFKFTPDTLGNGYVFVIKVHDAPGAGGAYALDAVTGKLKVQSIVYRHSSVQMPSHEMVTGIIIFIIFAILALAIGGGIGFWQRRKHHNYYGPSLGLPNSTPFHKLSSTHSFISKDLN